MAETGHDMTEPLTENAKLRAEVETLQSEARTCDADYGKELTAAKQRIADLEAALEPFAEWHGERLKSQLVRDLPIDGWLSQAAALLAKEKATVAANYSRAAVEAVTA